MYRNECKARGTPGAQAPRYLHSNPKNFNRPDFCKGGIPPRLFRNFPCSQKFVLGAGPPQAGSQSPGPTGGGQGLGALWPNLSTAESTPIREGARIPMRRVKRIVLKQLVWHHSLSGMNFFACECIAQGVSATSSSAPLESLSPAAGHEIQKPRNFEKS